MVNKKSGDIPLVSVVIITHNYGTYLKESVESVLNQTYANIGLHILDDGSTDNTRQIVKELIKNYRDIDYVYQKNQGIIKSRNKALLLSKGEFLIQLDADDILPKNYVQATVDKALKSNADVVYTNILKFGLESERSSLPTFSLEHLKNKNFIHTSSLLRIKSIAESKFDEGLSNLSHEDWDFYLGIALKKKRIVLCDETELMYRIHSSGRNNRLLTLDDRIKYASVYEYVYNKYYRMYPDQFDYMIANHFIVWYLDLYRQQEQIKDSHNKEVEVLEQKIKDSTNKLNEILNSRSYKLAKALANAKSKITPPIKR